MNQIKWQQSFNLIATFLSTHNPAQWAALGQYEIHNPLLLHQKLSPLLTQQALGPARTQSMRGTQVQKAVQRHHGLVGSSTAWAAQAALTKWKNGKKEGEAAWKKRSYQRSWDCRELCLIFLLSKMNLISFLRLSVPSRVLTQSYLPPRGIEHKIRIFFFRFTLY